MKVAVFGASGILGQHMRLSVPEGTQPLFCRRSADPLHVGLDLEDEAAVGAFFARHRPDVVVNLAGESRPDVVERDPGRYHYINAVVPGLLARRCDAEGAHYVHVSTQAVFRGDAPPYRWDSETAAVNRYGDQKIAAERAVRQSSRWTIVRPTFVLGVRPLPFMGRPNPVEQMLSEVRQRQVDDRFFSPLFARDAARQLWRIALARPAREVVHIGVPIRVSRYGLAKAVNPDADIVPAAHGDFAGLAPRPLDTTYACASPDNTEMAEGIAQCRRDLEGKSSLDGAERAREIAFFLGLREDRAFAVLSRGFHAMHAAVAEDFRRANPQNDDRLLDWYRTTEAYIWELSAYHCEPGWNYMGMCQGIAEGLSARHARRVLCLGDGIGDLTGTLHRAGIKATYHDLAGSRTAEFALFRFWMRGLTAGCIDSGADIETCCTSGWDPPGASGQYDAIVALDFLEHVTDVEAWTRSCARALKPGGFMIAQNAFAIGSGPEGSIPCHLARNDRFASDWAPLMQLLGMRLEAGNWWTKTETARAA